MNGPNKTYSRIILFTILSAVFISVILVGCATEQSIIEPAPPPAASAAPPAAAPAQPAAPAVVPTQVVRAAPTAAPAPAPASATTNVAQPVVAPASQQLSEPTLDGHELFIAKGCAACHGVDAEGTDIAPALTGHTERQVRRQPRAPVGIMPVYPPDKITDAELDLVAKFIAGLGGGHAHQREGVSAEDVERHHWMALSAIEDNDQDAAKHHIEHIIELTEAEHQSRMRSALSALEGGETHEAAHTLEEMLAGLSPEELGDTDMHLMLALSSIRMGDKENSLHHLEHFTVTNGNGDSNPGQEVADLVSLERFSEAEGHLAEFLGAAAAADDHGDMAGMADMNGDDHDDADGHHDATADMNGDDHDAADDHHDATDDHDATTDMNGDDHDAADGHHDATDDDHDEMADMNGDDHDAADDHHDATDDDHDATTDMNADDHDATGDHTAATSEDHMLLLAEALEAMEGGNIEEAQHKIEAWMEDASEADLMKAMELLELLAKGELHDAEDILGQLMGVEGHH